MLLEVSIAACSLCLFNKGKLLLAKDINDISDDGVTSFILFAPSMIQAMLWILEIGHSNNMLTYLHQVDVFLQAFLITKLVIHLRQCGMMHELSRAFGYYALLFLSVGHC